MTRQMLSFRHAWLTKYGVRQVLSHRMIHISIRNHAAQEFTMPAMSPTMTEGNITSWKVKEGDSFSAGDVLLEIETDKAQMDVEAQDDGVMARIVEQAGRKGVKVGTRIAVTADVGEDLESLDLSSADAFHENPSIERMDSDSQTESKISPTDKIAHPRHDVQYPLFPSVMKLLHENGINSSEAAKITATGPNGRLLKGDVLAYLGAIGKNYSREQSRRIQQLGHLDLSNVDHGHSPVLPLNIESANLKGNENRNRSPPTVNEVFLPVYLEEVEKVRHRIRKVLGVDVPVETFITRATELCNNDLPKSKRDHTSDELFNAILGLEEVASANHGKFLTPLIQFSKGPSVPVSPLPSKKPDIIDELTASSGLLPSSRNVVPPEPPGLRSSLFSVAVPAGDEIRGKIFLQRLKTTLQVEPGRLVL